MKFYFTLAILVQLALAFFSSDKNKVSYMLYLWGSLFDCEIFSAKNNKSSDSVSNSGKSKSKPIGGKYSFLLER